MQYNAKTFKKTFFLQALGKKRSWQVSWDSPLETTSHQQNKRWSTFQHKEHETQLIWKSIHSPFFPQLPEDTLFCESSHSPSALENRA